MAEQMGFADIPFVERRRDVRVIVNIAGRFSLSDRRDARGERRVFACRAVSLSPRAVALLAAIVGKMGERVIAHIDHLGKLEGVIIRVFDGGFVMSIAASKEDSDKLADKIEWLENHKNHDVTNLRSSPRIAPTNPRSWMILADASKEPCLVLDLSTSGAAISADRVPDVGEVLAIGTVVARVVRHFPGGFAVRFVEAQDPLFVEAMVIREPAPDPAACGV